MSIDLITIDDYKEHEGISSTKEDTKLESIVPSVSQLVKTYCANTFVDYYLSPRTETFTFTWESPLAQLQESPVRSIISVEERGNPSLAYVELNAAQYYLDVETDCVYRIDGSRTKDWPQGPGSVRVTYTAGYEEVPQDLRLALYDLVTYYLRDEHKERRTLSGASVQNPVDSGARNEVQFPAHIKRILDLYKNV